MFLSNLLKLGLYKSSCILFSCLFFVSCTTVSSKPTEVVSNAGSRKIASASAAAMAVNSSAFLAMQACPVLASIQSRIPSWRGTPDRDEHINRYNAEYVMNMLQETDSQGRTLHQRLMLELSSDSDCLSRIGDLRETICFYREYSQACEALYQLDKLKGETIIQEFEEFAGASIESIDPSQLADKVSEFYINIVGGPLAPLKKTLAAVAGTVAGVDREREMGRKRIEEQPPLTLESMVASLPAAGITLAGLALIVKAGSAVTGAKVAAAAGTVAGVAGVVALSAVAVAATAIVGGAIWYATGGYDKRIKNRRRPRRE